VASPPRSQPARPCVTDRFRYTPSQSPNGMCWIVAESMSSGHRASGTVPPPAMKRRRPRIGRKSLRWRNLDRKERLSVVLAVAGALVAVVVRLLPTTYVVKVIAW
jgi:hypothetical protein